MEGTRLSELLRQLAAPRILVLGDLILDRYTWGNAERVSQEAPVLVLRADRRESRLGGAANVCHMLSVLGARTSCAGVVGADGAGRELRQLLETAGVSCDLVWDDAARPTTQKERFVGRAAARHPSQILRVDTEATQPLGQALQEQLCAALTARVADQDLLLISDYAKGVCVPAVLRAAIQAARAAGVPVLVDPARGSDFGRYRGVTAIKPNRLESQMAVGRPLVSRADVLAAGRQLCDDLDLQMAVITLDADGMALVFRDGSGAVFPTEARAVYDITGAGDMVLAMLGLCLGGGVPPADAVKLANVAAALEVARHGVAVITREEVRAQLSANSPGAGKRLSRQQAAVQAAEHRARGKRVVLTNGCFDLLHVGHVSYLEEAAALGDVLIVAVNSDASVRRLKGPTRPVIGQQDRAAMLAALACVDHVVVFDEDTPHVLLHAIRPDVLVKGGTYAPHEVVGHEVVEAYGGQVCVTGVVDGISTTRIVASLAGRGEPPPDVAARPLAAAEETPRLRRAS